MRNIHVLKTDKPSRLYIGDNQNFIFGMIQTSIQSRNDYFTNQHIYITSDEEIKDVRPNKGKWHLEGGNILNKFPDYLTDLSECKLVIMTTDQDLIKDGVQPIGDEFLEWFVKNPSCEEVEVEKLEGRYVDYSGNVHIPINYKIIIPKEEPKQEQSAVEIISKGLFDILQEAEDNNILEIGTQNFKRYIEMFEKKAKEMEKEQIINACYFGSQNLPYEIKDKSE